MAQRPVTLTLNNGRVVAIAAVSMIAVYRICASLGVLSSPWFWGSGAVVIGVLALAIESSVFRVSNRGVWYLLAGVPLGVFLDAVIDSTFNSSPRNLVGLEVMFWFVISLGVILAVLSVRWLVTRL